MLSTVPPKNRVLAAQSCPVLCKSMDCSLPGFSVCEILQARILEWVASPFSRGSSQPRVQTQVSCIAGRFFTDSAFFFFFKFKNIFWVVLYEAARCSRTHISVLRLLPTFWPLNLNPYCYSSALKVQESCIPGWSGVRILPLEYHSKFWILIFF